MGALRIGTTVVGLCFAAVLHAQNITGTWQGTLKSDKELRIILQVAPAAEARWKASFYSIDQIDQATDPRPMSSFTFGNATLKFALDQNAGSYEGKLSSKGNTISGIWTQGKAPAAYRRCAAIFSNHLATKRSLDSRSAALSLLFIARVPMARSRHRSTALARPRNYPDLCRDSELETRNCKKL